jgi:hypothetical protein
LGSQIQTTSSTQISAGQLGGPTARAAGGWNPHRTTAEILMRERRAEPQAGSRWGLLVGLLVGGVALIVALWAVAARVLPPAAPTPVVEIHGSGEAWVALAVTPKGRLFIAPDGDTFSQPIPVHRSRAAADAAAATYRALLARQ